MAKVEYTSEYHGPVDSCEKFFKTFPANCTAHFFQQPRYSAEFSVSTNASTFVVSFFLKNAVGDESFQLDIRDCRGKRIARSNQQTCIFGTSAALSSDAVVLKCTVTFFGIIGVPRNAAMSHYIAACRSDPDQLLTFQCPDGEVKAVASLMCHSSDVIDTMMKSNFLESKTRVVKVDDVSVSTIQKMVQFCETGEIAEENASFYKKQKPFKSTDDSDEDTDTDDDIFEVAADEMDLCKVANKYNIDPLKDFSAILAVRKITKINLLQMYQFSRTHNIKNLENLCIESARTSFSKLIQRFDYTNIDSDVAADFWNAVTAKNKSSR